VQFAINLMEPPRVQLPLLDRFTARDSAPTRSESVRDLKATVRRDLEWLLNTRRPSEDLPDGASELEHSVYWYGLPELSSMTMNSSRGRADLIRAIQTAIATFEPRLSNVKVSLVGESETDTPQLRFMIDALLRMEPVSERVSFDTVLEVIEGQYRVRGDGSDR
jgi:type VI secretion system protein ImpF